MGGDIGRFKEGSVHETNNFGDVTVVKWLPKNKRIIKFINSGVEKEVSVFQLITKSVTDRIKDIYGVGEVFSTCKCGDIEIISKVSVNRRKIIFLNSKVVKEVAVSTIKSGYISDSKIHIYGIGKKLYTIDKLEYKIMNILDTKRRSIKFTKTGNIKTVSVDLIKSGQIKDKGVTKFGIGTIHKTNNCGNVVVIDVLSYRVRVIRFLNSNVVKKAYVQQIGSGELSHGNGVVTRFKLNKVCEDLINTKKTQGQIAIENGLSRSTVSQINTGTMYGDLTKEFRRDRSKIRSSNKRS